MESYTDRMQPAAYRGVPFKVLRVETEGGRRVPVHQFPLRDRASVEDLGRSVRRYSMRAFIIGDDFIERRDRLIKVLETPGPGFPRKVGGILVHPTFGRLQAVPETWRMVEGRGEGNSTAIDITFIESGDILGPVETVGRVAAVDTAADALQDAAGATVTAELAVTGPETIREAASTAVAGFGAKIRELSFFTGTASKVAALGASVTRLVGQATQLATSPIELVAAVREANDGIRAAVSNQRDALTSYESLFTLTATQAIGTSATTTAANKNATMLSRLFRMSAVAGAAQAGARVPWEFRGEAVEARDRIFAQLDTLTDDSTDSELDALLTLRRLVTSAVPDPSQDLPRLRDITLPRARIAAVLAYQLYGDVDREAEIITRNRLRHPGRVPGGETIQVLTR